MEILLGFNQYIAVIHKTVKIAFGLRGIKCSEIFVFSLIPRHFPNKSKPFVSKSKMQHRTTNNNMTTDFKKRSNIHHVLESTVKRFLVLFVSHFANFLFLT